MQAEANALYTNYQHHRKKYNDYRNRQRLIRQFPSPQDSTSRPAPQGCTFCGNPNHIADDCWSLHPETVQPTTRSTPIKPTPLNWLVIRCSTITKASQHHLKLSLFELLNALNLNQLTKIILFWDSHPDGWWKTSKRKLKMDLINKRKIKNAKIHMSHIEPWHEQNSKRKRAKTVTKSRKQYCLSQVKKES